jgi:glycosyltransferase involved in cell wall biosynthesis
MTQAIANEFAAAAQEDVPYEVVQVEGLELWQSVATTDSSMPRIIYDAHNAEATLQQRTAAQALRTLSVPGAAYSLVQWLKLRAFERNAIKQAAATLAVSPSDAAALERLSGRHVDVVPIGVDTARYCRDASDMSPPIPFDVVFSGTLDYRANTDAALWLLRAIWPRIRAAKPDATLAIVGRNPTPAIQRYHGKDGITITGTVPDDRPYMAGAGVYVLPIRFGAGVRVKLLNAMSMGCAIVATEMACEGVDVLTGEHLLATQTHPGAFAAAVVALLDDPERRARLGAAARALMMARYDWSVVTPTLLAVYERLGAAHG